ncbi:MAG: hypothetical protein OXF02_06630 [Simkaniaceae bacterium]|nr:hypothetical protein [Simkaniaceae bacterium]
MKEPPTGSSFAYAREDWGHDGHIRKARRVYATQGHGVGDLRVWFKFAEEDEEPETDLGSRL